VALGQSYGLATRLGFGADFPSRMGGQKLPEATTDDVMIVGNQNLHACTSAKTIGGSAAEVV
jgi:hypothetical protein